MILDKEGPKSDLILEVARDVCRTLGVSPAPEIVSWQDEYNTFVSRFSRSGGGRPVTPDFPVIDKNRTLLKPLMQGDAGARGVEALTGLIPHILQAASQAKS